MVLFGTKVEKALARCKKKEMAMVARYVDGNAGHKVTLIRFDKSKFIITGFSESLREDSLEVTIPELNIALQSRVTHISHDLRGNILYHLPMPEDLEPIRKRDERYFVYPHGMVILAPDGDATDNQIMSHNMNGSDAVKGLKMYLWDLSREGFEAVNSGKFRYVPGNRFSGKLKVGMVEDLFSAEVVHLHQKPFRKEVVSIVGFKFISLPKHMDQVVEMAIKLDER